MGKGIQSTKSYFRIFLFFILVVVFLSPVMRKYPNQILGNTRFTRSFVMGTKH